MMIVMNGAMLLIPERLGADGVEHLVRTARFWDTEAFCGAVADGPWAGEGQEGAGPHCQPCYDALKEKFDDRDFLVAQAKRTEDHFRGVHEEADRIRFEEERAAS